MIKKRWFVQLLTVCLAAILLSGCGSVPDWLLNGTNTEKSNEIMEGGTILEDDLYVYIVGNNTIIRKNKDSGAADILYEGDEYHSINDFSGGNAVLLGEKIFFWEYGNKLFLSCLDTAEGSLQRIEEIEDYDTALLEAGGLAVAHRKDGYLLTGYNGSRQIFYELDDSGTVVSELPANEISTQNPAYLPEGFKPISYINNGRHYTLPDITIDKTGKMILNDVDGRLCIVDAQTEESRIINGDLVSVDLNNGKLLLLEYGDGDASPVYSMVDIYDFTKEIIDLQYRDTAEICGFFGGCIYLDYVDEASIQCISCYDLAAGIEKVIYTCSDFRMPKIEKPGYYMPLNISEKHIFLPTAEKYKLYVALYDRQTCTTENIYEIYDSGIAELGTLIGKKEEFVDDDYIVGVFDYKTLFVDNKFPGSSSINQFIGDEMEGDYSFARTCEADAVEWHRNDPEFFNPYLFQSYIDKISFYEGDVFSFCQEGYNYTGGAHGMPCRNAYTFDLISGDRLTLDKVVGIDEDSFRAEVLKAFQKVINENADAYWEDALSIVEENISFESQNWYLTEDGLVIFFGPYELAPYAVGTVETKIDYTLLNMLIPVSQGKGN